MIRNGVEINYLRIEFFSNFERKLSMKKLTIAVLACCLSLAAGGAFAQGMKKDTMEKGDMTKTESMGKGEMAKDMSKGEMEKDKMGKDEMAKDKMGKDEMKKDNMMKDEMKK